jgi:hypothetical protein
MGLPIPIPLLRVSFKSTFAVVVLHYSEGSHHRELQDHDERRSSREPRRSVGVKEGATVPLLVALCFTECGLGSRQSSNRHPIR